MNKTAANFTNKASKKQLRSYFARPCDSAADAHQRANFVRSKVANTRHQGQMIERDIELSCLEVHRVCRGGGGVELEVVWLVLGDQIMQCAADIREEAVVLFLNRVCEDIVSLEEVAVVDVQRGELVLSHGVDLFDINELAFWRNGDTAI